MNGSRAGRPLVLGLLVATFVAGCGGAGGGAGSGSTSGSGPVVRVRYTVPPPTGSDEGYGADLNVIARGADQSRTTVHLLVEDGQMDETVLFVRDGNRALVHDPSGEPAYTLMEAADEHPDELPAVSSPLEPGSDAFRQACPDAARAGTRTILGRAAVGYACTWDEPAPALGTSGRLWLDQATGMLLELGDMRAREFVVGPRIDRDTFSLQPPAGADVDVVEATGTRPPAPDQGDGSPEDDLAAVAATAPLPVYYLGPEFDGRALSDVAVFDDDSGAEVPGDLRLDAGQSLTLWYGEDFQMSTTRFVPDHYRRAVGCRRLAPLRGVPAVEQAGAVSLFTADLVVWLGVAELSQAAPAAAALAEVGADPSGADLPAPPARNVALVDHACGAHPGDHGRPLPR